MGWMTCGPGGMAFQGKIEEPEEGWFTKACSETARFHSFALPEDEPKQRRNQIRKYPEKVCIIWQEDVFNLCARRRNRLLAATFSLRRETEDCTGRKRILYRLNAPSRNIRPVLGGVGIYALCGSLKDVKEKLLEARLGNVPMFMVKAFSATPHILALSGFEAKVLRNGSVLEPVTKDMLEPEPETEEKDHV